MIPIDEIEFPAGALDIPRAAAQFEKHGCLVVRGLLTPYLSGLQRDIEAVAAQAIALLPRAKKVPEGWVTPDGTLFLPAPPHYSRPQQLMVLAIGHQSSAAFLQAALDPTALDLLEQILGPNIEIFGPGQCLYKEPVGGHPKHLHQDSAYHQHRFDGPVGILGYVVDTDLNNGALHVVPGTHRIGQLPHIDTFSHLGLDPDEWPWERALPICGKAGDAVFFHYRTVHGSKENHSDKPRPVVIHRYRRPDDYVIIRASNAAARAEAERRAAEATKANQRGLMARGFRPFTEDEG